MEQCEVEESKLQDIRLQADASSMESQRVLREFEAVKAGLKGSIAWPRHVDQPLLGPKMVRI